MGISVYEDDKTDEIVINFGQRFDFSSLREFTTTYSRFESSRNFRLDVTNIENFDGTSLGMLMMFKAFLGEDSSKVTITNGNKKFLEALKLPIINGRYTIG
jgi:anti-anti-sigma regulatory factor